MPWKLLSYFACSPFPCHTNADLAELLPYPVGGATVLFGIIALVLLDSALMSAFLTSDHKQHLLQLYGPGAAKDHGEHHHQPTPRGLLESDKGMVPQSAAGATTSAPHHSHTCLRGRAVEQWLVAGPTRDMRDYVTAYTMELGCVVHSVIIGLALGVIVNDR